MVDLHIHIRALDGTDKEKYSQHQIELIKASQGEIAGDGEEEQALRRDVSMEYGPVRSTGSQVRRKAPMRSKS